MYIFLWHLFFSCLIGLFPFHFILCPVLFSLSVSFLLPSAFCYHVPVLAIVSFSLFLFLVLSFCFVPFPVFCSFPYLILVPLSFSCFLSCVFPFCFHVLFFTMCIQHGTNKKDSIHLNTIQYISIHHMHADCKIECMFFNIFP